MMKVNSNSTRTFIPRENELSDFSLGSVLLLFKMKQRNSGDLPLFHLKLKRNAISSNFYLFDFLGKHIYKYES